MQPVLLVGTAPYVLATNPNKPYRTFADVIAAAKEKRLGTGGHLAMALLPSARASTGNASCIQRQMSRTSDLVLDLEQQIVMVLFVAFSSSVWTRSR